MGVLGTKIASIKHAIATDANLCRVGRGFIRGGKALPSAAGRYLVRKLPVIQWVPAYAPQWLINDFIAGITNGAILIPQALGFALIAGISLQEGLFSIVLPSAIYAFTGTSRDMSIGPTVTTAMQSRVIVLLLAQFQLPAFVAIPVVSFATGIMSLAFGLLNLGFIVDFLSIPVINGFMMGVGLVVVSAQIPLLLGEPGVSELPFMAQGMAIITQIGTANPLSIAIGFSSVAFLFLLQFVEKKWGKKLSPLRVLCQAGSLIILTALTLISFFVNRNLKQAVWAVVGIVPEGLPLPALPSFALLQKLFFIAIPVFISTALEHLALARAFSMRNNYEIDASQELVSLGIANIASGLMGGMPVGSNIARSSVLEVSGVKTPLSGIFTTAFILLAITRMNIILFYMPLAVIGAILLVAVIECQPPQALLGKYWKISFIDFIATFFSFNITLLATPEMGIGLAVAFLFFYTFTRLMFSYAKPITETDMYSQYGLDPLAGVCNNTIPAGTQAFIMAGSVMFVNAYRQKRCIMDAVQTVHTGNSAVIKPGDRVWSDLRAKHIARLRRKANIVAPERFIPCFRLLILDFTHTTFVDATGMQMLDDLKRDIRAWGGDDVEFRFVGLNAAVKERFERASWKLASYEEALSGLDPGFDVYFGLLKPAIEGRGLWRPEDNKLDFGFDTGNVMTRSDSGFDDYEDKKGGVVIQTNVYTRNGKPYKRNND